MELITGIEVSFRELLLMLDTKTINRAIHECVSDFREYELNMLIPELDIQISVNEILALVREIGSSDNNLNYYLNKPDIIKFFKYMFDEYMVHDMYFVRNMSPSIIYVKNG